MTSVVCVRSVPEDEDLKISFIQNGANIEFNRKKNDPLKNTLNRIAIKLQPKTKKIKGQKANEPHIEIQVQLCDNSNRAFDPEKTNGSCFVNEAVLIINSISYTVLVNPPTVTQLKLPDNIMDNFPIVPDVKFEFASASESKYQWFRSASDNAASGNTSNNTASDNTKTCGWECVGKELIYTPNTNDVSYYLKCIVTPVQNEVVGPYPVEMVSPVAISAGPGVCLFDERHLYTPDFLTASNEFRVVSYNILADIFANTDFAKEHLYPYVPEYAIKAKYRGQLIMKELFGYHADLICLQECQLSLYENLLKPVFQVNGYESFLWMKIGEMPEGSGLFYRKERFEHISDLSVSVRDAMKSKCNENIVSTGPTELLEKVRCKKAVGQIHLLRDITTNKLLCVLNTHLYYERYAIRIRLLQIVFLVNYMHMKLAEYSVTVDINANDIAAIVCGDLNCNAHKSVAALLYLAGSEIKHDHEVWKQKEDGTVNPDFKFPLDLQCPIALSQLSGYPEFTVYVPHCKTTLDYIFGSKHLKGNKFVPLPDAEEIDPYVGLPCIVYPSDHLALVMDLELS